MSIILSTDMREEKTQGLPLVTRTGRFIRNRPCPDDPKETLLSNHKELTRVHQHIRLRSLSSRYNCVGLVFGARRTNIDSSLIPFILQEDGYSKIDIAGLRPGDVVVYSNQYGPTHIGIVYEFDMLKKDEDSILVLSKWGTDYGEYFHRLRDVSPLYGKMIEFWSEKNEP